MMPDEPLQEKARGGTEPGLARGDVSEPRKLLRGGQPSFGSFNWLFTSKVQTLLVTAQSQ